MIDKESEERENLIKEYEMIKQKPLLVKHSKTINDDLQKTMRDILKD